MEFDPSLITNDSLSIAIVGYITVFTALVTLSLAFNYLPQVIKWLKQKKMKNAEKHDVTVSIDISGEVNAAIAGAIHQYLEEFHDEENMVITIEKMSKNYSPWSSKIYSVTNLNR